jgi:DNA mismatch endonuclease, patch repair protein
MQGNRSTETRPEIALRSALHRLGLRFRKNARPQRDLRMRADVVFPGRRLAVFVDGCFWHGCPAHGKRPRTNAGYWHEKIDRNMARDRRDDALLRRAGWRVLRVWEHEPPDVAAQTIAELLASLAGSDECPAGERRRRGAAA